MQTNDAYLFHWPSLVRELQNDFPPLYVSRCTIGGWSIEWKFYFDIFCINRLIKGKVTGIYILLQKSGVLQFCS
jgi:hypothetical protein